MGNVERRAPARTRDTNEARKGLAGKEQASGGMVTWSSGLVCVPRASVVPRVLSRARLRRSAFAVFEIRMPVRSQDPAPDPFLADPWKRQLCILWKFLYMSAFGTRRRGGWEKDREVSDFWNLGFVYTMELWMWRETCDGMRWCEIEERLVDESEDIASSVVENLRSMS